MKYLTKFTDKNTALEFITGGRVLKAPQVSKVGNDAVFSENIERDKSCIFVEEGDGRLKLVELIELPADNEIWYTSSDKNMVVPNFSNVFGSNLVNNTYNNDTGVITFENTVTNIGDYAFYDCYLMTSIVIPNQVTSIGGCAFSECSSLTSITIPNSVSNIGWMAFSNCSSLNTINFIGSKEQWEKINKNADWKDEDVPEITVHCTDGDIIIPAWVEPA